MEGSPPLSNSPGTSPNVECFQNYTAPEVFVQGLAGMVNQQDTELIIKKQIYMLQRFEKTNEMLLNCNALSATRFQNAARDFKKHTALLQEMKKDIDNIFRRIRNIKAKISQQYPQAYDVAATAQRREKSQQDDDGDDDEEEEKPSSSKSKSSEPLPTTTNTNPTSSTSKIYRPAGVMDKSASIDIPKSNNDKN